MIDYLKILPDFVTVAEESTIMSFIKQGTPKKTKGRNTIQRFGSSAPYQSHIVSKDIPDHFKVICNRLVNEKLLEVRPDSVSVNEYFEGQIIEKHIDSPSSGEIITVLSLMSDATMVFSKEKERFEVQLPARSLVQMQGELRHKWMHEILPVPAKRYSIVFRCST